MLIEKENMDDLYNIKYNLDADDATTEYEDSYFTMQPSIKRSLLLPTLEHNKDFLVHCELLHNTHDKQVKKYDPSFLFLDGAYICKYTPVSCMYYDVNATPCTEHIDFKDPVASKPYKIYKHMGRTYHFTRSQHALLKKLISSGKLPNSLKLYNDAHYGVLNEDKTNSRIHIYIGSYSHPLIRSMAERKMIIGKVILELYFVKSDNLCLNMFEHERFCECHCIHILNNGVIGVIENYLRYHQLTVPALAGSLKKEIKNSPSKDQTQNAAKLQRIKELELQLLELEECKIKIQKELLLLKTS